MKKTRGKEKQVEMEKDGHKITVPQSRVQGRKVHGYKIVEADKTAGGK